MHRERLLGYHSERVLKSVIDGYDTHVEIKSFETALKVVAGRVEILRGFVGDLPPYLPIQRWWNLISQFWDGRMNTSCL